MASDEKIFRDPLYNYIVIDRAAESWLLKLLECPEVQRLRRIHQLGVTNLTYSGAEHTRFSHSLGVLHLMQQAWKHLKVVAPSDPAINRGEHLLLAAALLHDVGHGPFSHLLEPCLGVDHEEWSRKVICDEGTGVNRVLCKCDIPAGEVAALIQKGNYQRPPWQKNLLSSELDVDRLDYLRRDSLFTGAGYGHFDWYRILNSFRLHERSDGHRVLVWPDKAKLAIEEYIFARFYMYNNVYQHKTTRGFEQILRAAWDRARRLKEDGTDAGFVGEIGAFLDAKIPTVAQYLAIEDATVLHQLQIWTTHPDGALSDLARRFLYRDGFAAIEDPHRKNPLSTDRTEWEAALGELAAQHGFHPPECYVLRDDLNLSIYAPYSSEKEKEEQNPYNAIFVDSEEGGEPVEISQALARLKPFTGKLPKRFRYYVPKDLRDKASRLRDSREW
jgi:HD superfamily phosphohydrolase